MARAISLQSIHVAGPDVRVPAAALRRAAAADAWGVAAALALAVFFLTRLGLCALAGSEVPWPAIPAVLALGFLRDLPVAALLALPFALQRLVRSRPRAGRLARAAGFAAWTLYAFSLLFVAASEAVFWGEFGTRFNFIAVDYLIYTHEVIGNIRESYAVGSMLAGIAIAALAAAALGRRWLHGRRPAARPRLAGALALLAALCALPLLDEPELSANAYENALADNGWRSFVAAARNNRLDFARFYATLPEAQADAEYARLAHGNEPPAHALTPGAATPQHVVLVTVESLSAEFLGSFGDTRGLTPNLDRYGAEGLLFSRLYAIGTRTVRGLEALSAALPPLPGQSLVKRPGNAHLHTLGGVLAQHGWRPYFIYGGYGYFDNMNAYFADNGYRVIDRSDFPAEAKRFENVWGVADEHLFDQVLATMDREAGRGPVFAQVMTTSNHRPFTYPDGRIDIASPGGREAGVKYTDWAIGRFIEQARSRPWFANTLFVIVADHCASSAGKTRLPVPRYHIPAIVYAPGRVAPQRVDHLASQIDLAPTLLALLGIPEDRRFAGRDILTMRPEDERAFIANYQELGYLKHGVLTVLSPRRKVEAFRVREDGDAAVPIAVDPALARDAIAWYQGASRLIDRNAYRME